MGAGNAKRAIFLHLIQYMWIYCYLSFASLITLFLYHLSYKPSLYISVTSGNPFMEYYSSQLPCQGILSVIEHSQAQLNSSFPQTVVYPEETEATLTNAAAERRKARMKNELPNMIQSNELTRMCDVRVREFFSEDCNVRFFMTWISPVKSFRNRELLAVESIFKAHPSGCLIILSSSMDSEEGRKLLDPITDMNFKVAPISPDFDFLLKGTPAESWFNEVKKGNIDPGTVPFPQNLSNLLRLAALYKYGGVYLDTDVIVLKAFSGLKNTIGAQSAGRNGNWSRLNNAVLVFDEKHPLVFEFIKEFSLTFNGSRWGNNGPLMVSRVAERAAEGPQNFNFTVLLPRAGFYPVNWLKIVEFFRRPESPAGEKWAAVKVQQLSNGETYAIHLWNKHSRRLRIEEGSILERLISDHCLFCKNNTSIH